MNSPIRLLSTLQETYNVTFKTLLKYRWPFAVLLGILITIFEIVEHRQQNLLISLPFLTELFIFSVAIPILVGIILSLLVQSEETIFQIETNRSVFERISRQIITIDNWKELCEMIVRFPFEITSVSHSYFFHNNDLLTKSFILMSERHHNNTVPINYPTNLTINSYNYSVNNTIRKISEENFPGISIPEGYTGYCFPFFTDYTCFAMLHLLLPATYQISEKEISDLNGLMPVIFSGIIRLAPFSAENIKGFEQERLNLSRHLHDTVGQNLGFLLMKLDQFKTQTKSIQSNNAQKTIEEIRQIANEAYEQIRFTLTSLQSSNTHDLAATLYQVSVLVANRQPGLDVQMTQEGHTVPLPSELKQRIVAICREGLINIVKHAQATKVELTITWQKTHLYISIKDNGTGIQTKTDQTDSFGLNMMFERAAEINATMKLKSQAGQGLEVVLRLPLPDQETVK